MIALKMIVIAVMFFASQAFAGGDYEEIKSLFPEEGLRYKSCHLRLLPADEDGWTLPTDEEDGSEVYGYAINIKRDCPSGNCYNYRLEAEIMVNAQQIEVFGKTLTNHHKIDRNNRTTALQVKEYDKWEEENSLGLLSGLFGGRDFVLIGYVQTQLEMRIDSATGQVEKFQAYYKGSVNWGAALQGGLFTTLRAIHGKSHKRQMVECESPAAEIRPTLADLLEQDGSVYEVDKVISYEKREALENKLLQHLSTAEKDELTDTSYFGHTPLHYAARLGLVSFARQLIAALPQEATDRSYKQLNPLNFQDANGHTPLHLAALHGQAGMIKLLLATKGVKRQLLDRRKKTAEQIAVDNATKHCEADASSQACKNAQEIVGLFAE